MHAHVVCKPGQTVTLEDLQGHCKSMIAGYKVPRSLKIADSLPMSGAGKILKNKLRETFWSGRDRRVAWRRPAPHVLGNSPDRIPSMTAAISCLCSRRI